MVVKTLLGRCQAQVARGPGEPGTISRSREVVLCCDWDRYSKCVRQFQYEQQESGRKSRIVDDLRVDRGAFEGCTMCRPQEVRELSLGTVLL